MILFDDDGGLDYQTSLLLHLDGNRNILDYSRNRKTITSNGSAAMSSSYKRFGSQSLYCPSTTSNYVSWASKASSQAYTGKLTVDFWLYTTTAFNTSLNQNLCGEISSQSTPVNGDWAMIWSNQGVGFYVFKSSGAFYYSLSGTTSLAANTWHHIFAQYNDASASMQTGIDGTVYSNVGYNGSAGATGAGFGLGNFKTVSGSFSPSPMYFQEFRISDGVTRYPTSGTYTIPQIQYG